MEKRKAIKTDAQITDVKTCGELNAATLKMFTGTNILVQRSVQEYYIFISQN